MSNPTTTDHHPGCRESDKNLVWHCSQCGLNESAADIEAKLDQPKPRKEDAASPATGECTLKMKNLKFETERAVREKDFSDFREYWRKLAETHGCTSITDAFVQLKTLREQLAAAVEALKKLRVTPASGRDVIIDAALAKIEGK